MLDLTDKFEYINYISNNGHNEHLLEEKIVENIINHHDNIVDEMKIVERNDKVIVGYTKLLLLLIIVITIIGIMLYIGSKYIVNANTNSDRFMGLSTVVLTSYITGILVGEITRCIRYK